MAAQRTLSVNIFLCWSGTRSRKVAECLRGALKPLGVIARMSPDIAKGAVWFQRITRNLSSVEAGIVVMTPENLKSPWLHFEAGALALTMSPEHKARPRIFPYLFHTQPLAVDGPLGQYQLTVATKEDTIALVEQLLRYRGRPPQWGAEAKDRWWKALAGQYQQEAATLPPTEVAPALVRLFSRKTFREPVQKCVARSWLERYNGSQTTLEALRAIKPEVDRQCRPYARDLLERLIQATDAYAMTMGALLLKEIDFDLDSKGDLAVFPSGVREACESRRIEALRFHEALVAETQAPVFEESPAFERLDTFAQKKDLVHRKEAEIRSALKSGSAVTEWWKPPLLPGEDSLESAATSSWILDRILYYVARRERGDVAIKEATDFVWLEWEKARSQEDLPASRMPLHYSLDVLEEALKKQGWRVDPAEEKGLDLERLFGYLDDLERKTPGSRVAQRLRELRVRISIEPTIEGRQTEARRARRPAPRRGGR